MNYESSLRRLLNNNVLTKFEVVRRLGIIFEHPIHPKFKFYNIERNNWSDYSNYETLNIGRIRFNFKKSEAKSKGLSIFNQHLYHIELKYTPNSQNYLHIYNTFSHTTKLTGVKLFNILTQLNPDVHLLLLKEVFKAI